MFSSDFTTTPNQHECDYSAFGYKVSKFKALNPTHYEYWKKKKKNNTSSFLVSGLKSNICKQLNIRRHSAAESQRTNKNNSAFDYKAWKM